MAVYLTDIERMSYNAFVATWETDLRHLWKTPYERFAYAIALTSDDRLKASNTGFLQHVWLTEHAPKHRRRGWKT